MPFEHVWSLFSSFTFVWAPGTELRSPGLHSKCCYLLSHLVSLKAVSVVYTELKHE